MDIRETRRCNLLNLGAVARYLRMAPEAIFPYYEEILADAPFLVAVNRQVARVRGDFGFSKGIFGMENIDSVDWFAFARILFYVLIRLRRPQHVVETGVFYGGNTAFMLRALDRNGSGSLTSIDLPDSVIRAANKAGDRHPMVDDSELYTGALQPGCIVPAYLRARWRFIEGDALEVLPTLSGRCDLFVHDSDHAMGFMLRELVLAHEIMAPEGLMIADDIDWSNAFHAFVVERRLYPLLLTDNGKDDLRVRTGLVDLKHPWAEMPAVTGERLHAAG